MVTNFRNYTNVTKISVENTYKLMYEEQTLKKKKEIKIYHIYSKKYTIKEIIPLLNNIIDESDPDTDKDQSIHLLQTYISIKKKFNENIIIKDLFNPSEFNSLPDEIKYFYIEKKYLKNLYPHINEFDWIYLVGYLHDLGKIMMLPDFHNFSQHFCVGDIYPLGIPFEEANIFYDRKFHENNIEFKKYKKDYNLIKGFDNLDMTISHDYYLYKVLENTDIPKEGLYMIRYHSFYAFHTPKNNVRGYEKYADYTDWTNLPLLKLLQKSDLYSKSTEIPKYEDYSEELNNLINKYCPGKLDW